jgi:hypothetical protein
VSLLTETKADAALDALRSLRSNDHLQVVQLVVAKGQGVIEGLALDGSAVVKRPQIVFALGGSLDGNITAGVLGVD